MDLLGNNEEKKQKSKSQSIVGSLLIISIIALIIVIALMVVIKRNNTKNATYSLFINDLANNTILIKKAGEKWYVALEDIAKDIGYTYYNGEYLGEATEEKTNCYLKNENEVICFKSNESEFYKTAEDSLVEKQKYKIENIIINNENKLYIAIDDIKSIFNMKVTYLNDELKIVISTTTRLAEQYKKDIETKTLSILLDTSFENLKTIARDMLVVTEDGQYGVVDLKYNTIIGNKYKTMKYDEYTNQFIVSDSDDKFGVITKNGSGKISLKYDSISIINYEPLLYAITKNQKYGVINENGKAITNIEFNSLACEGNKKEDINSTLIIHKIDGENDGIVVCKENKYGIINLSNGEYILNCIADKINSRTNTSGEEEYFAVADKEEIELTKYIKTANTVTVNLTNTTSNEATGN